MRRQRQARVARNTLAWAAGIFALLQLSLTAGIESLLPQFRDPCYAFKAARLRRRVRTAAIGAQRPRVVVMLGSSQVADGLRGSVAEAELDRPAIVFNLGIRGDGPYNELLNFERLLADGVRPDLVLVEVLPALLSQQSVLQFDLMPAERMGLHDRSLLRRYKFPVEQLRRYSWVCWGMPWYAHRLDILSAMLPGLLPAHLRQDETRHCDDGGWAPFPYDTSPRGRQQALGWACASYAPILTDFRLGNPFCPALRSLLDRCHEERIPAALVLMPEGDLFRRLYSPRALRQLDAFLTELTAPYGNPVIDARTWVPEPLFIDSHHLLPEGATVFSRRLGRESLLPLLRNPPRP